MEGSGLCENDENMLQDLTNSFSSQQSVSSEALSPLVAPDKPWVQDHFTVRFENGERKRYCQATDCQASYHFNASHSVLRRHWSTLHQGLSLSRRQQSIAFDEQDHIDALYVWILKGKQTYATLDDRDFRDFIHKLAPNRDKVHDIVLQKAQSTQQTIIEAVKETKSISTCFDIWTSRAGYGFGCVTAHFFGKRSQLRSVVLEFKRIKHPHDGATICAFLKKTFEIYGIERKVVSFTSDNASNNILAISMLVEEMDLRSNFSFGFLKFRCCAHIIDLGVKKALIELSTLTSSIKMLVLAIRGSSKRTQEFQQIQGDLGRIEPLQLVEDVCTRWNSTFRMLERALLLRGPIDRALVLMKDLKDIRPIDWFQLEECVKFLGPFNELTERLSGEKYPTLPLVMAIYPNLVKHLREGTWEDETIARAANAFRIKLEEYEGFLDQPVAVIAMVLDPRFKLGCLDPVAHRHAKETLSKAIENIAVEPVRTTRSDSFLSSLFAQPSPDEVDSYLNEPRANENCNVERYWMDYAVSKWPRLAELAKLVLNIQATSVACERANSRASLVDTPHRSRLSPQSIRANVLMNSWLNFVAQ